MRISDTLDRAMQDLRNAQETLEAAIMDVEIELAEPGEDDVTEVDSDRELEVERLRRENLQLRSKIRDQDAVIRRLKAKQHQEPT
jgi:predicted RNase H-like nuclease (RuvC/YqgF family)